MIALSRKPAQAYYPRVNAGLQIGAYRLLQQIGAGGMGAVWLAEHAMLGRRAAIKVLHPEFSQKADIVKRFFNEARAATSISDPGIVQIFDFGQHIDGSAYIVMELLEGEALDRRLDRVGTLPLHDALRIMRQVSSTLGAAHARGIVHRDLKPENIFICPDREVAGGERAKVLDFGIAKLADAQASIKTQTAALMGTPTYMSPEQCRGAGLVDQRSDVYAIGCVLFRLLCGRPPFEGDGIGEIIASHLREPAPVPSSVRGDIPPAVDQLILRCLAKDPLARLSSGSELAAALDEVGGARSSVVSSRAGSATTLSSTARVITTEGPTHSRRAVVLPITMVGLAAGLGLYFALGRSPDESSTRGSASEPPPAATAQSASQDAGSVREEIAAVDADAGSDASPRSAAQALPQVPVTANPSLADSPAVTPPPAVVASKSRRHATPKPLAQPVPGNDVPKNAPAIETIAKGAPPEHAAAAPVVLEELPLPKACAEWRRSARSAASYCAKLGSLFEGQETMAAKQINGWKAADQKTRDEIASKCVRGLEVVERTVKQSCK